MTLARSLRPITGPTTSSTRTKDDGGRKLSQLSPGTEKAARHDGKFGTSAPDSSRLRHSSRQRKPRHRGCTQHAGVHLSWTAGAQNSSRVAWREWPWLARNGCHIASLPQHRSTFLRHFGTQDAERPAISLAARCNQFRRDSIGPKSTTGLGLGKNVKSIFPFAHRAWQNTRVRRRPGEKNRGCPLVCLHLCQMLRLTEFGAVFSKLLHKLSLKLIGLRLKRRERPSVVTNHWHRRSERTLLAAHQLTYRRPRRRPVASLRCFACQVASLAVFA